MDSPLLNVDVQILILASSLLIPIIHGVITKATASPSSKVVMTLVLTAVAGLIGTGIAEGGSFSRELLLTWSTTFVVTITTHYGIFKPLSLTSSTGTLQQLTKGKGVALLGTDPEKQAMMTDLSWAA